VADAFSVRPLAGGVHRHRGRDWGNRHRFESVFREIPVRLLPQAPDWVILVGRIGFLTRSLVFLLIGVFLVGAGLNVSSSEAKGLAGALRSLEQQSYGSFLLGLTGAGLVAFAVFEAVQARWRKIEVPRTKSFPS
jgi:Domain of Unknown Function (DUF1206)